MKLNPFDYKIAENLVGLIAIGVLSLNHEFHRDEKNFIKDRVENNPPLSRLTGDELLGVVDQLPSIKWGKNNTLEPNPGL